VGIYVGISDQTSAEAFAAERACRVLASYHIRRAQRAGGSNTKVNFFRGSFIGDHDLRALDRLRAMLFGRQQVAA
jgi:hypothetical protein